MIPDPGCSSQIRFSNTGNHLNILYLSKLFFVYLKARLLGELVSFGVGEVVVREGGIQRGNQMEQSFPAHINSGMKPQE
jgi:hypothetical protein